MRGMPLFDAAMLLHEYADEGLVRDLAQLVVATTPTQIDAVKSAVANNDSAALRAATHKLRGSIVTFGMADAVATAKKLEEMGAAGDLTGADALARQRAADVQSLCESAKAWLERGAPPP